MYVLHVFLFFCIKYEGTRTRCLKITSCRVCSQNCNVFLVVMSFSSGCYPPALGLFVFLCGSPTMESIRYDSLV